MMTMEIRFHSKATNGESKAKTEREKERERGTGHFCYTLLSFHMSNTQLDI